MKTTIEDLYDAPNERVVHHVRRVARAEGLNAQQTQQLQADIERMFRFELRSTIKTGEALVELWADRRLFPAPPEMREGWAKLSAQVVAGFGDDGPSLQRRAKSVIGKTPGLSSMLEQTGLVDHPRVQAAMIERAKQSPGA